jgi:hypothetical protein
MLTDYMALLFMLRYDLASQIVVGLLQDAWRSCKDAALFSIQQQGPAQLPGFPRKHE